MKKARRTRERGNAMIESALTAVLLFMLTFGIVGFGRAVWAYGWVSHAAREASRWAAVRGSQSGRAAATTDVTNFVTSELAGLSNNQNQLNVSTVWAPNNDPGSYVQVTVQYTCTQIVPWVPQIVVSSRSKMMIAQ
ncbi:MAG: TadE/TadG family type IV pilus assembly protein [Terriglobales bacterium]